MPVSDTGPEPPSSTTGPVPTASSVSNEGPLLSTFGPYQLQEIIGRGGMGEIYRAYDTDRRRVVALKRLPASLAADPTFRARFRAEAALAAKLHEPHVIPIHDFGEIDGQLYIDMRLVEGPDLAQRLRQRGPLPAGRVVEIVSQVAAALDAAHAAGLVHRDIKPGNVLLVPATGDVTTDFVYVADFGIARAVDGSSSGSLTSTGATIGSMDYVAPERFGSGHGDRRADIYALGCVLYEALTAQRPFPVEGLPAVISAHLNTPPPAPTARRPGLPAGLDAVVARAMAKSPDDRYRSAGALAADARRALDGSTVTAFDTGPTRQVAPAAPVLPHDHAGLGVVPAAAAWLLADSVPTVVSATPPTTPPPRGSRRRGRTVLAALATTLVLAGAVVSARLITPSRDPGTAVTEPTPAGGANPFMPSITTQPPKVVVPVASGGTVSGSTAGLYGGTLDVASCDPAKMVTFLLDHPDKGAAWAGVEGVGSADLPAYVAELTPVLLRADTAVTNHGFANSAATTLHSVLQAGTAVLVDRYGVPRARCACGNPLTPSTLLSPTGYTGARWAAFDPAHVVTVAPTSTPVTQLSLVDPVSLTAFTRPVGGNGASDRIPTPPPTASPTPVPAPRQPPAPVAAGPAPPVVVVQAPQAPQEDPPTSDRESPSPPPAPPGPVRNLVGVAHNDSGSAHIDLSWDPPDDLHGNDIAGYQITSRSAADPLTTTVTGTGFIDRDQGRNCASDRSYTVRAVGRAPDGGDALVGEPASVPVALLLDCTPEVQILSSTATGNQVTVTVQCSGGGRGGQTHGDLAVQLDGDEKWTGSCVLRFGGGGVGSSQYTAVIDDVDAGDHQVTATSSTISGTKTSESSSVTVN